MKIKRSERIVDMTAILINNPRHLFSLNDFTNKYKAAKSSISEDMAIIKDTFQRNDLGIVETLTGANGGVIYYPKISGDMQRRYVEEIIDKLSEKDRILPGGYFYLTDIISDPIFLKKIGKIMASQHIGDNIDYVLTVATKGVSIAQALAYELGVPFVIARKETKITEGSTVSVKYRSLSAPNLVRSMEIGRESIRENSRIILVDDFFRGGGTINGMASLVEIFKSQVVASYVVCEFIDKKLSQKLDTKSLVIINSLDIENERITLEKGSIFNK